FALGRGLLACVSAEFQRQLISDAGQRMRAFGHAISLSRRMTALGLLVLLSALLPASASALTLEQARESCGASTTRPLVQACMQSFGKGSDREANLVRCRATAQPKNKACV